MSKFRLFFLIFIINVCFSQKINSENKLRSLKPKPPKKEETIQQTKLLQTLYSDSYSNNYYYTTLYVGDKQIKQTYIIDTGIATMSSPCAPCEYCGKQKTNYYDLSNKKESNQLKCSSKVCKLVPATACMVKEKNIDKKSCSFFSQKPNGDGLRGYYLSNIVYFEENKNLNLTNTKKVYTSYALPLGCTLGEYGQYKDMTVDGVMGLNNDRGSFSSVLYNLKIINSNIFSLCFGLEGGYMSLGEIDTTYHASKKIDYIPLLNSTNYLININGIQIGKNKRTSINVIGNIDTSCPFTYLPKSIYRTVVREFDQYCIDKKGNNRCGKFVVEEKIGYCASFEDRETLFKTVSEYWPVITIELGKNIEYTWQPINYYYYYIRKNKRKACLGFLSYHSDKILLGSNFMHGYDMIFDREKQLLGFVQADCSRRNLIYNTMKGVIKPPIPSTKTKEVTPALDKEIHKKEKEEKFDLGDNDNKEGVEFIKGGNKELERMKDFQLINYIILLISILVVVIVLLVVIIVLICKRKEFANYQNITSDENKHLNNPQNNNPEESNELNIQQNNISEETNDNKNNEDKIDDKVVDDNKVTNEDVQFLKNIMKNAHK